MRCSLVPSVSFALLAALLVGSTSSLAAPAVSPTSTAAARANQRPQAEAIGLDVVADRIMASAATLPGTPPSFDQQFLQYAYTSRKELAYRGALSITSIKIKQSLANRPGSIFDALVRFEAAEDCTGTATMALYATAVELVPTYSKLAQLIDLRLASFERAADDADPFPFIKCASNPKNRTRAQNSTLALALVIMKREMVARGATGFSSTSSEAGVAARLAPSSREQLRGLHPRPIKIAVPG